jgi:hypothetical protein
MKQYEKCIDVGSRNMDIVMPQEYNALILVKGVKVSIARIKPNGMQCHSYWFSVNSESFRIRHVISRPRWFPELMTMIPSLLQTRWFVIVFENEVATLLSNSDKIDNAMVYPNDLNFLVKWNWTWESNKRTTRTTYDWIVRQINVSWIGLK